MPAHEQTTHQQTAHKKAANDDKIGGLAGRYATALFEIAEELPEDAQQNLHDNVAHLGTLFNESDDLLKLIRSPIISAEEQAAALGVLLDKMGASHIMKNFVGLIIAKHRVAALPDIARQYHVLVAQARNELVAHVTSAQPLQDAQINTLKAELKKALDKNVHIETTINPALLGGLIVKLGSRMVDGSLRHKLNSLKISLNES